MSWVAGRWKVQLLHLIGRLGDPAGLRACYGPCGFELHRLLSSTGVACDVVTPSLIARRAGDRE